MIFRIILGVIVRITIVGMAKRFIITMSIIVIRTLVVRIENLGIC